MLPVSTTPLYEESPADALAQRLGATLTFRDDGALLLILRRWHAAIDCAAIAAAGYRLLLARVEFFVSHTQSTLLIAPADCVTDLRYMPLG